MKLILTRPLDDSRKILDLPRDKGYEPIINPLLEILYLKNNPNIDQFTSLLFTSRHAIRSLKKKNNLFLSNKKIYVCGKSTYQEASELGVNNEYILFEDSTDLINKLPKIKDIKRENILYLRGQHISSNIIESLKCKSIYLEEEIIYEAIKKDSFNQDVINAFAKDTQLAVLIYSERTAQIFIDTLEKYELGNKTSIILAYCLSKNIAQVLKRFGISTRYSERPTNEAIFELI